jgi:hypothetical protein
MSIKINIREHGKVNGMVSERDYRISGNNADRLRASETLRGISPTIESEMHKYRDKIDADRLDTALGKMRY